MNGSSFLNTPASEARDLQIVDKICIQVLMWPFPSNWDKSASTRQGSLWLLISHSIHTKLLWMHWFISKAIRYYFVLLRGCSCQCFSLKEPPEKWGGGGWLVVMVSSKTKQGRRKKQFESLYRSSTGDCTGVYSQRPKAPSLYLLNAKENGEN